MQKNCLKPQSSLECLKSDYFHKKPCKKVQKIIQIGGFHLATLGSLTTALSGFTDNSLRPNRVAFELFLKNVICKSKNCESSNFV